MQNTHSQPCVTSHTIFILHETAVTTTLCHRHNTRERFPCLTTRKQVEYFRFILVNYLVFPSNSFNPQELQQRMLM
jgi:hypothetical protein